jgi:integrase
MLGLRPGELIGLRWDDVDLEEGTLMVSGSLKNERGQLRLGETKTKRARAVQLPAPVLAALKAHSARQKEERLKVGSASRRNALVFTNEVGTPIEPSNLRRMTKTLCEDAGVDAVSPNELGRLTAASLLYDAGMPLDEIAEPLGHKSTRMLETHYKHPRARILRRPRRPRRSNLRRQLTRDPRTGCCRNARTRKPVTCGERTFSA